MPVYGLPQPELKLKAIKRNLEITMTLDIFKEKNNANSVNALIENVKNSRKTFNYLEWSKEKSKKARTDFENLYQHSLRFRSQYR